MKDLIENTFASVLGWSNISVEEYIENSYDGPEVQTVITKIAGNGVHMQYRIHNSVWDIIQNLSLLQTAYKI